MWQELGGGRLALKFGEGWEVGLKQFVGGGIGGGRRWILRNGGRWAVGPTNSREMVG